MNHEGRAGLHAIQQTILQHIRRTEEGLLRRLEHQANTPIQFLLLRREEPGGLQQHGGVHVVAAGMHTPVAAGKGKPAFLPDGQGIHVCPQQDALLPRADVRNDAASAAFAGRQAHFGQFLPHIGEGIGQIKAGFSMGMKITAVFRNAPGVHPSKQIIHQDSSFRFDEISIPALFDLMMNFRFHPEQNVV